MRTQRNLRALMVFITLLAAFVMFPATASADDSSGWFTSLTETWRAEYAKHATHTTGWLPAWMQTAFNDASKNTQAVERDWLTPLRDAFADTMQQSNDMNSRQAAR